MILAAGVSNFRSGLRRQYPTQIDGQLLALLAGAGLDIALADALQGEIQETFQLIQRMG